MVTLIFFHHLNLPKKQPKNIEDLKLFLQYLRGDDSKKIKSIAKSIVIKTKNNSTKFKLRCSRYLYTLKIDDQAKAEKIRSSIKPEIKKIEITDKARTSKKSKAQ